MHAISNALLNTPDVDLQNVNANPGNGNDADSAQTLVIIENIRQWATNLEASREEHRRLGNGLVEECTLLDAVFAELLQALGLTEADFASVQSNSALAQMVMDLLRSGSEKWPTQVVGSGGGGLIVGLLAAWCIGRYHWLGFGLLPYKDTFFSNTTMMQTSGANSSDPAQWPPFHGYAESDPLTHALMSLLSMAPVTFSDAVDATNKTLVMMTCTDDGVLLKPDRPATAIDAQFQVDLCHRRNQTFVPLLLLRLIRR